MLIGQVMINIHHTCHYMDDFDKLCPDEPIENIRGILFEADYLTIFQITDFNDKQVEQAIEWIIQEMKDVIELNACAAKLAATFYIPKEDEEESDVVHNKKKMDLFFGYVCFFSYQLMGFAYPVIAHYLKTKQIDEKHMRKLLKEATKFYDN